MDCRTVDALIQAAQAGNRHMQLWEPEVVSDEDIERIAQATREIPTFTHLGFFRCNLTPSQVKALCRGLSCNVKHLLLQYSNIGDFGMYHVAELLKNPVCGLERLFVCDDRIGDAGLEMLARSLEGNRSLRFLCVTDNIFTNDGLRCLHAMLKKNTTLKDLHFSGENNSVLDRDVMSHICAMQAVPEVRADWQRVVNLTYVTVPRLSKNSAFRGFPKELVRLVKDALCEKVQAVPIRLQGEEQSAD